MVQYCLWPPRDQWNFWHFLRQKCTALHRTHCTTAGLPQYAQTSGRGGMTHDKGIDNRSQCAPPSTVTTSYHILLWGRRATMAIRWQKLDLKKAPNVRKEVDDAIRAYSDAIRGADRLSIDRLRTAFEARVEQVRARAP